MPEVPRSADPRSAGTARRPASDLTFEASGAPPAGELAAWLDRAGASCTPPLHIERIPGGRSNLTFRVTDAAGRRWVVRRPPLTSALPSAHDVGREYRVMAALRNSPVPVPTVIGEGEAADETPYYVMDYVEGVVLATAEDVTNHLPVTSRTPLARKFVEKLARLHQLDPVSVGLEGLGRGVDFLERQLGRWHRQWRLLEREQPEIEQVHRAIEGRVPAQRAVVIVHGDYRLDNAIIDPAQEAVSAVVDWELCTLGEPLVDFAITLAYWSEPGDEVVPLGDAPTLAAGMPSREQLVAWYEQAAGRPIADLATYLAFAYWRLAVVLEGIDARARAGAYGEADMAMTWDLDVRVAWLLERAVEHLNRPR